MSVLAAMNKRTIRAQVNPLDKSTIVSIYPREIDEIKYTITPGRFIIAPGSYDNPSVLTIGPSSWWREVSENEPLLEIPCSSIQVADSIVKDYCNGVFGCNMDTSMPGLFFVPGEYDVAGIKKSYKSQLDAAKMRQNNFFSELVKQADSLWARSNGNPLAISDDMRMAARELAMVDKDWLKHFQMVQMVRCFACGTLKNPEYPICASCRVIDPNHSKAKDVKFATV